MKTRVFVAGATGALEVAVVRQLMSAGYNVTGLSRTNRRIKQIEALGATSVTANALDIRSLHDAVRAAQPEAIVDRGWDETPAHALAAIWAPVGLWPFVANPHVNHNSQVGSSL